jgi:hypothetical protein
MPPRPLFAPPRETIRSVEIPVEGPIVDAYAPSPDTPSTVPPVAFSVVPTPIPGSYRPSLPEVDPILLAKMGADVALRRAIFTRVVKGAVAACGAVCLIAVVCLAAGGDDGPTSAAPPKVKPRSLVTERESLVVASNAKLLARKSDKPERSTPKVVAKQATSRGSEATTQRGPTRAPGPRRK